MLREEEFEEPMKSVQEVGKNTEPKCEERDETQTHGAVEGGKCFARSFGGRLSDVLGQAVRSVESTVTTMMARTTRP